MRLGKHSHRWKQWLQLDKAAVRRDLGLFLVEGPKLLMEALRGRHRVSEIVFDPQRWSPPAEFQEVPLWEVSAEMLERISDVEHSQGVVALVKPGPCPDLSTLKRVLVCDHLADPGNQGALMRTAWAAGLDGLVALGGVDLFHPKVVRASAGAVFHLPCYRIESLASLSPFCKIALAPRDGVDLYAVEWPDRWALVVGNEAHGIGAEVRSSLDLLCSIPMEADCESLNAAVSASIVLFEWRRRMHC